MEKSQPLKYVMIEVPPPLPNYFFYFISFTFQKNLKIPPQIRLWFCISNNDMNMTSIKILDSPLALPQ